ncbi:ribonuclease III [Streptomyces sp. 8N114]|uniref:ribonuclease III n=1 Tax=Streptomyces sp. 8N114 TaxID=3457419 RepID=UPI003FD0100E
MSNAGTPQSPAPGKGGDSAELVDAASSHAILEGRLGYRLESALLVRALTHRSYAYENGGLPTNERLEFLGDSVLGLVVTDTLYRMHPDLPEGQLAKLRAAVVNSRALAGVARGLDLGAFIRLGRGEEGTGGRDKASILADTLEAVIGAVYLDQGLEAASELVHRLFDPLIERSSNLGAGLDWKTSLQELTAAEGLGVPEYLVSETGPDHEKTFTAAARVGGVAYGTGTGRSKKEAEQQAAEAAWRAISARNEAAADAAAADVATDTATGTAAGEESAATSSVPDTQRSGPAGPAEGTTATR